MNTSIAPVAIIGAGPYGLSVASHLAAKGIEPLVFGPAMDSWRNAMPRGMRLKSEGFASSLSDPKDQFTLETFCVEQGLPYADLDLPVPVEAFAAYGEAFQRRFVPQLDPRVVRDVTEAPHGFSLRLEDGTRVEARAVIVAAGIMPYKTMPDVLSSLSSARVSHTSDRADYSSFAGRHVAVIGAGASAVDAAASLSRAGATVTVVTRRQGVTFHAGSGPRGWWKRVVAPLTPLGPGWKKLLCVRAPLLFRILPARLRVAIVQRYLGPAPGWSAREDFEGKVALKPLSTLVAARETARGVELAIATADGRHETVVADHVVAGTGYAIDVARLRFLAPSLRERIGLTEKAPKLTASFESTVPGLYFAGTVASYSFGPMLRFVCGTRFAAKQISDRIVAVEARLSRRGRPVALVPSPLGAPRVVFLTLLDDCGSDRIVAAMARLGAECAVLGAPDTFAARSRFTGTLFPLPRLGNHWTRSLLIERRLRQIVRDWRPDLVVPLDEHSARLLRDPRTFGRSTAGVRCLIERSLGSAEHFHTVCSRRRLVEVATAIGIRSPRQEPVRTLREAERVAASFGYPVVLKRDQTCGGFGVAIVRDDAALARAFRGASRKALAKRIVQAMLGLGGPGRKALVLQSFVPGPMAFCVVACAEGIVLDGMSFIADQINPPLTGASTVVRPINRPDMDEACRKLVAALGCSGLVSVDFILTPDGASVIELNPRPPASGHLGRLYGHDVYAALLEDRCGLAPGESRPSPVDVPGQVALFPRELDRDRRSAFLDQPASVLHDVPDDDPDLVGAYAAWLIRRHVADGELVHRILGFATKRTGPSQRFSDEPVLS